MTTQESFDVVVVGGGHNGLACAAWLARAGLRVLVLERNAYVGGGVVTREVTLPGFRHDLFSSSHVWLQANPYFQELRPELQKFGLEYLFAPDQITAHPFPDGRSIILYADVARTLASIAQFSERDAQRYKEIYDGWIDIRDGYITQYFSPPVPPSLPLAVMENSPEGLRMLRNYNLSPRAWVLENFEHPYVQSFILSWALAPNIGVDQSGVGRLFYIMIPAVHNYGEAIPLGGSGMLSQALARYVEAHGGTVLTGCPVVRFLVAGGQARGVQVADGRTFLAEKAVVSGLHPRLVFPHMLPEGTLPQEFVDGVQRIHAGRISVFRTHYALEAAPRLKAGTEVTQTAFWRIASPDLRDFDRQYAEIEMGALPTKPALFAACWSLRDATRAPAGKHTLILDTFAPFELRDGADWEQIKADYDQVLWNTFAAYTENMTEDAILGRYIITPPDLERLNPCFVDGDIMGGDMSLAQSGYFRPVPGWSQYRSPIDKLYLAGPSCHPGGGVTMMGIITANVILEDLGLRPRAG